MVSLDFLKIGNWILKFSFHKKYYSLYLDEWFTSVNNLNFSKYDFSVSNLSDLPNVWYAA